MPTITTRKIATVAGLGLSSVLLASNASADVDTSTYPKDIQGLLTEAKQLGLEIVQEPQETITTSGGARTYYEKLRSELSTLVENARAVKSQNDEAVKTYEAATKQYEDALTQYEASKKEYDAKVQEYNRSSEQYRKESTAFEAAQKEYQKALAEWSSLKQADEAAQKQYEVALAEYEKAEKQYQTSVKEYEAKKAEYDKAVLEQSQSSSTYESQKRAYQEAMRQYADKKSQYDEALKVYTSAKSKYDADLATYNKILADNAEITKGNQSKQASYDAAYKAYQTAKSEYDAKLTAYNQQVAQNEKAKASYQTAVSDYQAAKKKYDQDVVTYQSALSKYTIDKKSYDAKMAEMERNKNIPGHLSQAMSQSLIFSNEPNATVTITGQAHNIKSSSWEGADGVLQKFASDHYRSTDYGSQPEAVKNALEGSPDNLSYPVIMNNNSTTTVEYNNLQNTSYKGRKISKVVYKYTPHTKLGGPVVAAIFKDPALTIRTGSSVYKDTIDVDMEVSFFYADGSKVTFDNSDPALVSFASMNAHDNLAGKYGEYKEYVKNLRGFQFIPISGSTVGYVNGVVQATRENASAQATPDSPYYLWDSPNKPTAYYGAGVGLISGNDLKFTFGATRDALQWFQFNSKILNTDAIVKPAEPQKPKEPIKPTEPKIVEPTKPTEPKAPEKPAVTPLKPVPTKPSEPTKPNEPEKPKVVEPQAPTSLTPTPPTPPTPLGERPKAPTPKAGEKLKEPVRPNTPQPKEPNDGAVQPPTKPQPPTLKTVSGKIHVQPVTIVMKTTHWVTTSGVNLKPSVTGEQFLPKDSFDGYEFVETKVDGNSTTHIYRPVEKPKKTTWVDEQGNKLKDPKDGEHPDNEGDDVPGYTLVRIDKDKDGNVINIYRKTPEKPVEKPVEKPKKTTWVDEQGNKLKDPKDGEHPDNEGDDVPGYTLVRIDKDKDGNVINVYRKTPEKPVEKPKKTTWVDEQGNKLKDPKDGEHPDNEGDDVPGYTLIHIKKDTDGNIVNVYRKTPEKPVEKPKKTTWVDEKGNQLKDPKDGEHPDTEGDDVPGYELVRIDKDKDGNIVNVYEKIKQTTWVDEKGNKLKDPKDGEHPDKEGDDVPGYKLVRIDKDKDGNIVNVYQKVETPKTPEPQAKELPKTGDATALTALLGLASLIGGFGTLPRKKRD